VGNFRRSLTGGGLGAPAADWGTAAEGSRGPTTLVSEEAITRVIAAGGNPVTDPRTRAAYRLDVPSHDALRLLADGPAMMRLREVPDLAREYLAMRWLRYGPLTAALAHSLVLKEALFRDCAGLTS
jgi:hypothetical protein